jgi:two-component system, NtrC family, response regulator PilR
MTKTLPAGTGVTRTMISCINVDSDAALAERIRIAAGELGLALFQASLTTLTENLAPQRPEPVLAQFSSFGPEAISLLASVRILSPDAPVIVILEQDSMRDAVSFIREGAFQCLGPDVTAGDISIMLQAALEHIAERQGRDAGHATEPWRRLLIGQSLEMERVATIIKLVAPRRCTVLISGETGTGKEMVARAIHMAGDRARRPMVSVNCGALPENLIEAELFGHVKGAFTGATENRIGRFEQADGGTLFLDEIGDLPYDMQAKLLRVLQEREIQKLGGTATTKVDVRVIAATNANLLARVEHGSFREDLYYRLNVVPIRLAPLRERVDDIPLLVRHFVRKVCTAEGLPGKSVTLIAMDSLIACSWPGNVRQLENVVEQSVVMNAAEGFLGASGFSLPQATQPGRILPIAFPSASLPDEGMDLSAALRQFERTILDQALTRSQGNKTAAADMLRLPRTTLIHKLRALDPTA